MTSQSRSYQWRACSFSAYAAFDLDKVPSSNETLKILPLRKFCEVEVIFEYVQTDNPGSPLWYYGYITTSPLNSFPNSPEMGLIPVSHILKLGSDDIHEEVSFMQDVLQLSSAWPELMKTTLAKASDLNKTYLELKKQYVDVCHHILTLQNLKHDMKGDYSHRFNDAAKALTYSVDRFNCELGMGDVLLRDDDNRIVTRCDRLSWAYEKLVQRRKSLFEKPQLVRSERSSTISNYQDFMISMKKCCLLVQLKSLRFSRNGTKPPYCLRISVYTVPSQSGPERPSTMQHEPFMILLPEGHLDEWEANEEFDPNSVSDLASISCLFKDLELKLEGGKTKTKIVIYCDLMTMSQGGTFDTVATTTLPAHEELENGRNSSEIKTGGFKMDYAIVPPEEKLSKVKNNSTNVVNQTLSAEGSLVTQFVMGEEEDAVKCFNLKPSGSLCAQVSQPVYLKVPPQPGAIRNEVFIKLSKLEWDKPIKEKKRLFARVQLLKTAASGFDSSKVARTTDHYDKIEDSVSVAVGPWKGSVYFSPTMQVPKSTQSFQINLHDVIKLDLGDLPLHDTFVLISFFKDHNDKPEASEVDFFLPLTEKLFQMSTVKSKGIEEFKLQGYSNLKSLDPRNLERLSATVEKKTAPVTGKASKVVMGAMDHILKPSNEQLVVFACTNSSFSTNAERLMSQLIQVGDEKLYQNLCSNLPDRDNFDFTLWVLPHVLLNTLDYLSDNQHNNNALAFLLDLLQSLDRVSKNQSYLHYLTDENGEFLKLFRNKKIWWTFLEMTLDKLSSVNNKKCESNLSGGTLVAGSPDITPGSTKEDDFDLSVDEKKFLSCGHYIWPWIKRSISLDLVSNSSKPSLTHFIELTRQITEHMKISVKLENEDYRILARFATHAWSAFPHMSDGLKHVRRLNLQIESLSTCYDSPNLNNIRYRATFQKIVEAVLGHTVQVLSALRKYYAEFSFFLQKLVRFYHDKATEESFNFNTADMNFLLAVFENARFWLENGSDDEDDTFADSSHSEHQMRILCSAVEFIQLVSSISLAQLGGQDNSDLARMVRQLLKLSHDFVLFSENNLSEDYTMLRDGNNQVHILMTIYQFLYQKDTSKTSIFQILLLKLISPDESGDQYTYVFQLLFKVCHVLMCSKVFRLEHLSIPQQNLVKKCIKHADNPDTMTENDARVPFVDVRHCLAYLLKSVHDGIMWPLVTSRDATGAAESSHRGQPYPLADILHMSLASPEGYTLSCCIEILADAYCFSVKTSSQAYPELIRAVDTFIGFKHKMGDQSYADRFRAKLTNRIESSRELDPKEKAHEKKRIDQVCTIQMKDLLNIRSAAESGLDPDLQILYTSDLLRFYAGSKFYRLDVDLSSNVLFIRYHMRLYSLNMEFGILTSAAECLVEFVILLERFDKISATRPNSVDHLAEEVPSEFYKPGFTTIEMSIELLKKAASLYERQKLYEAADAARDQLSNFYYRKLDYEGIAMNYVHRAELACKIKGISFQEKVDQIMPQTADAPLATPISKNRSRGGFFTTRTPTHNPETQNLPNIRVIHTRGFNLRFYLVRFYTPKSQSRQFPKVFEGKTFIYSRENLFPPEFENYLRNLFPDMEGIKVEQEKHGKNQMDVDILYAPLVPQLMLPKRFKLKPFLPSSSHEVEFYKTHAISVFEKRISVECVEELQHIEYSDESALQMMAPGERTMPDENKRRKLIDEWKKQLKTTATHGMMVTRYKLMERNLVHETDSEPYPGKCRWQVIRMLQQPVLKYSCELAKGELMGFLQQLCGIYSDYVANQHNPVKQFEVLSPFIDIITKLAAPIQGGLKRQCIAFCSSDEYKKCTAPNGRDVDRGPVIDFNRHLQELLKALVIVSRVCDEFVESNKENERLKDKVLDNLTNAAYQFKMHIAGIFDEAALATDGTHDQTMATVSKFVTQDYLNRIMKTDSCIHDAEKRFVPVEEQRPVVPKKPPVATRLAVTPRQSTSGLGDPGALSVDSRVTASSMLRGETSISVDTSPYAS